MRSVRILCLGVQPLMMDRMSDEVLESLDTGVRLQLKKDRPVEEKAEEKIYRDKEGRIGLSPDMLLAALVNAGRNVKIGKKQISTATTTTLFDFFQLKSEFLFSRTVEMATPPNGCLIDVEESATRASRQRQCVSSVPSSTNGRSKPW